MIAGQSLGPPGRSMAATIASALVAAKLFRFVQIEVPWPLGPEDGRYVVRRHAGEQPDHVLVLATLGAEKRTRRGRKDRSVEPEPPPTPVATGRATIVDAVPLESE